jgi:hypothetical protein
MMRKIETTMSEPERIITELETEFPALSGVASMNARNETPASGQSVLQRVVIR